MKKYINIVIFLFIFCLYFVTFLMIYDNFRERKLNSEEKVALELFDKKIDKKKKEDKQTQNQSYTINYSKYTILGKLQIPKIGLNTVIIQEQTYSAMNVGAVKTYGVDLNEIGGTVISGHNFRGKNAFFYYILNLKQNDVIKITDNKGVTMDYRVYEVQRYVSPDDVSYLSKTDNYHVTLVTCENGGKTRIIVKAKVM